jgi:putative transposase
MSDPRVLPLCYVLMPNHFHLLLEVQSPTARIMQSLLTAHVRRFHWIHRYKGHLFQGRYKAIACDRDSYLLELLRYIHLNPLRAKMVKRPRRSRFFGLSCLQREPDIAPSSQ